MPRRFIVLIAFATVLCGVAYGSTNALAISYAAGWNLVSGPAGSTLVGATGSLYTLQPGDTTYEVFPAASALRACWGYWAYFPSGGSLNAGSDSRSTCNVNATGWVMVGNPSLLGGANVSGAQQTLTYSPANGYANVTGIPVGAGAWVYASGSFSVLGPQPGPASAAPTSTRMHTWYTSSASNSTAYYCDDDPDWQTLSPRNLQSFPTVAALLAVYPNKQLHRPCLDGATGP